MFIFLVETEAEALMLGSFRRLLLIVFIEFTGAFARLHACCPIGLDLFSFLVMLLSLCIPICRQPHLHHYHQPVSLLIHSPGQPPHIRKFGPVHFRVSIVNIRNEAIY
jgi:hypothetical protein